jgi:hypothetical protein
MGEEALMLLKKTGRKKKLPERTVIRCPSNGLQVSWCRGLCLPTKGIGTCGRPAPHVMRSRYQRAIAAYEARQKKAAASQMEGHDSASLWHAGST